MKRHQQEMIEYIMQQVDTLDRYRTESLRRLYHLGFLYGFLARLFMRDHLLLKEFLEHIRLTKEKD